MTPREKGFLLLTSPLGNPERRTLTVAQLRTLAQRVNGMEKPVQMREMTEEDVLGLGYGREMASRILSLLSDEALLRRYLSRAKREGCVVLTRVSENYPRRLRRRLGLDSPGCLWAKGDCSLLESRGISLVGSRDLLPENRRFAAEVGRQAALQGLTLISGNARGADRTAQEACLAQGGKVIIVVADELEKQPVRQGVLYISEDGFDLPFTTPRALSRNRVIHSLGEVAYVAQTRDGMGGTWNGTVKNLRSGWTPVACFRDGSEAVEELLRMGAVSTDITDLHNLLAPTFNIPDLFHRQ